MTASSLDRRHTLALIPVVGIGVLVAAVAAVFAGPFGAAVAVGAVVIAVALYAFSELLMQLIGLQQPLERLLFPMLIRSGGAMAAILLVVTAGGLEPRLVALIAAPIYLGLVAGDAVSASRSAGADASVGFSEEAV